MIMNLSSKLAQKMERIYTLYAQGFGTEKMLEKAEKFFMKGVTEFEY